MNRPPVPLLAHLADDLPRLCDGLLELQQLTQQQPADLHAMRYLLAQLLPTASASRDRVADACERLQPHRDALARLYNALPEARRNGASYLDGVPVPVLRELLGE